MLEKWYPTIEEGNNKGIVVLVTSQKEGAITGGPAFIQAVGETVLDNTVSENLPGRPFALAMYKSLNIVVNFINLIGNNFSIPSGRFYNLIY